MLNTIKISHQQAVLIFSPKHCSICKQRNGMTFWKVTSALLINTAGLFSNEHNIMHIELRNKHWNMPTFVNMNFKWSHEKPMKHFTDECKQ